MQGATGFKVIKNGKLFDGTGSVPLQNAALLIENDRISYVGPEAGLPPVPEGTTLIDANARHPPRPRPKHRRTRLGFKRPITRRNHVITLEGGGGGKISIISRKNNPFAGCWRSSMMNGVQSRKFVAGNS